MSRIVVVSLASLVAVAALALNGPFGASQRRAQPADAPAAQAAHAASGANANASTSTSGSASASRSGSASATTKPTGAPEVIRSTPRSLDRVAYGAALVAAFAGGVACAGALARRGSLGRRRQSAHAPCQTHVTSGADPASAGAPSSEWQMLDGDEHDLVSLHDADGVIRYASGPLLELTGFSRHELLGRPGRDFVHPDDLPTLLAALHAARWESQTSPALLRLRDRRGGDVWIEAEFRHSVSRTGEPEMLCVARSVARSTVPLLPAAQAIAVGLPLPPGHGSMLDLGQGPSLQDLCHAFERREFELHYQLKVGLSNWEVTGVEALLRWNAPEGVGRTAEIIAAAERTGFIVTLGEWVMRAAAHQCLQWRRAGFRYPIAVNVSTVQLNDAGFVPLMRELVSRDRELPAWLELEVTEQGLAGNSERAVQTIAQLVALGFTLHVDDFGTGYSKLAQLSRMPLRALKIDRSIVHDLAHVGHSDEVVGAVVSLSRALRVKVIAEGVETHEQLERLRAHGCDEVQGYLFSRPASAEAVRALVVVPAVISRQSEVPSGTQRMDESVT